MHLQQLCLVAMSMGLLAAQSGPAVSASPASAVPPGTEEALRERIRTFYTGYVDQKLRKSYDIAADDSKDAFLTAPRAQYRQFEIQKIEFSDDHTAATVTTLVQSAVPIFGVLPPLSPELSHWKYVDGEWYWYVPPPPPGQANISPTQRLMMAMFHIPIPGDSAPATPAAPPAASAPAPTSASGTVSTAPPPTPPSLPPGMPGMMPGMMPGAMPGGFPGGAGQPKAEAAKRIRLDRHEVEFSPDKSGSAVVSLSNATRGEIHFAVVGKLLAGLAISPAVGSVAPGRPAEITISWTPPQSAAKSTGLPAEVEARVSVVPGGLMLPLTIHFR